MRPLEATCLLQMGFGDRHAISVRIVRIITPYENTTIIRESTKAQIESSNSGLEGTMARLSVSSASVDG